MASAEITDHGGVPAAERAFYEAEFAGATLVVALDHVDDHVLAELSSVSRSLRRASAHLVIVVPPRPDGGPWVERFDGVLSDPPVELAHSGNGGDRHRLADLWLAITDQRTTIVVAAGEPSVTVAGRIAGDLRARKLIVTDPEGGWEDPPRSFADVAQPSQGFAADLAGRQGGLVVPAIEEALAGGVLSVNLCRAEDLDRELFTFDGTGTLFTRGGYLRIEPLRVEDLPEMERLVHQGTADGVLRPRSRHDIARLATTGLGARVLGGDHLAGVVGLETEPYEGLGIGEVACLYAVSRFSGAGAGGMLVDSLVEHAETLGLHTVFAVTVSDAAAAFFLRKGFVEGAHEDVPSIKWDGYDAARRAGARVFLRPAGTDPAATRLTF